MVPKSTSSESVAYGYASRHAELYDQFYADKPYDREAEFVADLLVRAGVSPPGRLLDLACGTGRHAIQFSRRGFDVTGVDISDAMLGRARTAAMADPNHCHSIRFHHQDMSNLELENTEPFDAAYSLFDSIGYVVTNDAVRQVLAGVRRQLRSSGLFLMEFWHAPPMLKSFDRVRVRRLNSGATQVIRISETSLDIFNQTATVNYTIVELHTDGSWQSTEESHTNRFFQVQEMAAFLHAEGFQPLSWSHGFEDMPVTEHTWHVVVLAQRKD